VIVVDLKVRKRYFLNDRIGRKWCLRIYEVVYILGSLISTFSFGNIGALYTGRLVAGFGIGALTVVGPMAIVEIAPRETRGLLTLWFNVSMLGSQMIGKSYLSVKNRQANEVSYLCRIWLQSPCQFKIQSSMADSVLRPDIHSCVSDHWLFLHLRVT
jgi:cyanate permease